VDIAAWLRELGLERYEPAFRDNEIDGEVLPRLTAEDLIALGVTAVGHRRKLLDAVAALRKGDVTLATGPPELTADTTASTLAEGERRQVTVLFADLSGYTRLSREIDAEELHVLAGRFFDVVDAVVEGYGGTVRKHIGDCIMAVFGAPVAHSNDPERAARAALDIQRRVPALADARGRPLGVHIGVASGQVVASGTGSARHREYTVTGESVNLASRLTDAAQAGEVLISDAVHRALAERLACAEAGALVVKGFAEPVRAWRLLGLREAAEPGDRPFVGRHSELQRFRALLAACQDVGHGQAIYVRGEAGIGKTRLVEEFQAAARRAGFVCHTGLVLDFGAGTGQDAIRSLVRSLLRIEPGGGSDRAAVQAAAEWAVADGLVAAERRVYLNDLLDLPQPVELRALYDAMDSSTRARGTRETVAELIARVSAERPLLLVIEDVHWADRPTLDHLATLTETAAEHPAVLVMTSRVEGDPLDDAWRSHTGRSPLVTIDLGPLRPQEAEILAGAYFMAHAELARRCVERAAGNPLFLEQLLRHAEESAESGVPGSVQSLVQARMDRLNPPDKLALQAASVLGQRFDLDMLGALLEQPGYDAGGLVRHRLVRPHGGDALLFAHVLIRDGVYDLLLKSRRRELHRRAAALFAGRDPVLHAEHLDRAEDPGAPRAYLEAARAQAGAYRTEAALALVERGVALAHERADVFALTCYRGEVLHDLGRIVESMNAYRDALEAADDDGERCRAWRGLAAGMRITDRFDEAFAALDAAEALASERDLAAELAHIHHLRGNLYFPLGRLEGCLREHELSRACARRANSPELEARALGGLGDAEYARGRMITAYGYFHRCVELCRQHGLGRIEVANLPMAAFTRQFVDDLRGGSEDALAAIAAAARVGDQRAEIVARLKFLHAIYICSFAALDLTAAREHAEIALALCRRLGARRFESETLIYVADVERASGRRFEALKLLKDALAISRETGIGFFGPAILGALALATEDPQERQRALTEGEALLANGCVSHNYLLFYPDAMEACLIAGDWDGVERYAAALEAYTRPEPLPWADLRIARGRALARYGRGECGEPMLRELRRLREEADRIGWKTALPPLERALVTAEAFGGSPPTTQPGVAGPAARPSRLRK
jgi:class 3 adenylate cyclase/tetratricopeptide (TPR) repeat protein